MSLTTRVQTVTLYPGHPIVAALFNCLYFYIKQQMKGILIFLTSVLLTGWSFAQTAELVKDINTGSSSSAPSHFIEYNNKVFFRATTDNEGNELWVTDGTNAGTYLFMDIYPGNIGSYPDNFQIVDELLYFTANDSLHGNELWVTNGTDTGTYLIADIASGGSSSDPLLLSAFKGELYFHANGDQGEGLWKLDTLTLSTSLISSAVPDKLISTPDLIYFISGVSTNNNGSIWATDGTVSGTYNLTNTSGVFDMVWYNSRIYFNANGPQGNELWVTDGTLANTTLFKDIEPMLDFPSYPGTYHWFNGRIYFLATQQGVGYELHVTYNHTYEQLVKNINPGSGNGVTKDEFANVNNKMFFVAYDTVNGEELWYTNGTDVGTLLYNDLNVGVGSSNPNSLMNGAGKLYFIANEGSSQMKLYITNGDGNISPVEPEIVTRQYSIPSQDLFYSSSLDLVFYNGNYTTEEGAELYKVSTLNTNINDQPKPEVSIKHFPDPTSYIYQIEIQETGVIWDLFDISGKHVLSTNLEYGFNLIDVSALTNGMYIQRYSFSNGTFSNSKMMISK